MKKDRIYIQDWLGHHSYEGKSDADSYYLQVSNDIHDHLKTLWFEDEETNALIKPDIIKNLSIHFACYLEDVVSQTNLFHGFRVEHQKLYGKLLPFFEDKDLIDYYPEDINKEDVLVLTWLYLSEHNPHFFFDKKGQLVELITNLTYPILEEHYEVAPENHLLQQDYHLAAEANYQETRNFTEKVIATNYLTGPSYYNNLMYLLHQAELHRFQNDPVYMNQMSYRVRDNHFNFFRIHLLSLKPAEFVAAVLGEDHPKYLDVKRIGDRINSFFTFEKEKGDFLYMKHCSTKKTFEIHKDSIQNFDEKPEGQLFYMEIVAWKAAWSLSGVMSKVEESQLNLDSAEELNQIYKIEELDGKMTQLKKAERQVKDMQKMFTKDHKGLVAFMEEPKVAPFMQAFISNYRKKAGFEDIDQPEVNSQKTDEKVIITAFFNPKLGIELFKGIENLFPVKNNSFYQADEHEPINYARNFLQLLIQPFFPSEIATYYYEQYKTEIDEQFFFPLDEHTVDFFLRFFKTATYFNSPRLIINE